MVDEVLVSYRQIIQDNNISVFNKKSDSPKILFSRVNAVRIISILLSNAIQYRDSRKNSTITIECIGEDSFVLLSVTDNGIGIREDQFGKIFKIFKRLDTKLQGTGIGLYIAKRIIENSNGKITVKSKPGIGSTFTVFFPVAGRVV